LAESLSIAPGGFFILMGCGAKKIKTFAKVCAQTEEIV
jgi:hypothetical protein